MIPVFVVKKDKRRELFDAAKVRNGIIKACGKRPVPLEDIERLVRQVETRVCQQPDEEVTTEQVAQMVMELSLIHIFSSRSAACAGNMASTSWR